MARNEITKIIKIKIKLFLKYIIPPILLLIFNKLFKSKSIVRKIVDENKISFEGNYKKWMEALNNCSGYDSNVILSKVLSSTLKIKTGEAVFERDSVLFDHIEYSWPVLAGLLFAAARSQGNLNVLDFGGSLGSSYFQNRKFLKTLNQLQWSVIEQSHYVNVGKLHIEDEHLKFYTSIDECLFHNKPNVVLLSSVLQYLESPYDILNQIILFEPDLILFDRTCYQYGAERDQILIQRVPSSIYKASYPCWFFDEKKLLNFMDKGGYKLIEEFQSLDKLDERATWKGHIFSRMVNG